MDKGIIIALVTAVVFLTGIVWIVIYSNRRIPQKNLRETSLKAPEPEKPRRVA